MALMTSDEIYELKKTWEIPMADATGSGVVILETFLTRHPSNLQKFQYFKDVASSDLNKNPRFRSHALRIMRVFDDSIQLLGYDIANDKLEEIWSKLAVSHFYRQIEKGTFTDLRVVIMEILSKVCNLNETQVAAWTKFFDYVYDIVFKTLDKIKDAEQ